MDKKLTQLELIQLAGKYLTYEEFLRSGPYDFVSQTEWYRILEGDTAKRNEMALKRVYNHQFKEDWKTRKSQAKDLIEREANEQD